MANTPIQYPSTHVPMDTSTPIGPSITGMPTDINTGQSDWPIGVGSDPTTGGGGTIGSSGILGTLGGLLDKLGGGNFFSGLGNAGLLALLGMGEAGNLSLQSQEGQTLNTLVNLLKSYASMTPAQAASGINAFEQPMSQGLMNETMNKVQAAMAERGFAGAPGLMGEATAEALAPYQLSEQQLASQNFWNLKDLPVKAAGAISFPPLQNLSGLISFLASGGFANKGGGGVGGLLDQIGKLLPGGGALTATPGAVSSTAGGGATTAGEVGGSVAGALADPAATLADYAAVPLGAAAGTGLAAGGATALPITGSMAADAGLLGSLGSTVPGWLDPSLSVASAATGAGAEAGAGAGVAAAEGGSAGGGSLAGLASMAVPAAIIGGAALGLYELFNWANSGPTPQQKANYVGTWANQIIPPTTNTWGIYARNPGVFGGTKAAADYITSSYKNLMGSLQDPNQVGRFMTQAQIQQDMDALTLAYKQALQQLSQSGGNTITTTGGA